MSFMPAVAISVSYVCHSAVWSPCSPACHCIHNKLCSLSWLQSISSWQQQLQLCRLDSPGAITKHVVHYGQGKQGIVHIYMAQHFQSAVSLTLMSQSWQTFCSFLAQCCPNVCCMLVKLAIAGTHHDHCYISTQLCHEGIGFMGSHCVICGSLNNKICFSSSMTCSSHYVVPLSSLVLWQLSFKASQRLLSVDTFLFYIRMQTPQHFWCLIQLTINCTTSK